jgi:hypothetical protein
MFLISQLGHPSLGLLIAVELMIVGLHQLVERNLAPRKDSAWLRRICYFFNLLYSVASLLGLVWWLYLLSLRPSVLWTICDQLNSEAYVPFFAVYFFSKLWEGVIDLNVVTLRAIPVSVHFRVHHYTTPVFAWIGWAGHAPHAFLFAGLNLFMHVMVYAWHGGVQPRIVLPLIRFWQHVQLLGGIAVAVLSFSLCSQASIVDLVPAACFATYYVLFQQELRQEAADSHEKNTKKD